MTGQGWLRSLRVRIALAAAGALAVSLLVAGALLLSAIERDGRRSVDEELAERAAVVLGPSGGWRRDGFGGRPVHGVGGPRGSDRGGGLLAGSGSFVRVIAGGAVAQQRGDEPGEDAPVPTRDGYATYDLAGVPWRGLSVPLRGYPDARVELLQSLAGVEARVDDTRRLALLFGLAALGACAVAAWGATAFVLRPLGRLRGGAARVSGTQDLSARLPREAGDPAEVAALTDSLNAMLGRLEDSARAREAALEATRRFAADAGHELRTPLTGLRANLDALLRPELADADRHDALLEMATEQGRMLALLEGLQALARGEAADALRREPVELGELVDAAVHAARGRHPETTFVSREELGDDDGLRGWPEGLRMLVDNLLTNAAVHGRPGGRVEIVLRRHDGDGLELLVDDDGPGVTAEERERVLEPFVRGRGTSAAGTGLGLAVVAQQAALHGGDVLLGRSPLGGLRAHVRLPVDRAATDATDAPGARRPPHAARGSSADSRRTTMDAPAVDRPGALGPNLGPTGSSQSGQPTTANAQPHSHASVSSSAKDSAFAAMASAQTGSEHTRRATNMDRAG